jgi:SAM-dependent methyltransferase
MKEKTMNRDNTTRFSDRVADYRAYRPSYPAALVGYLADSFGLSGESEVADIGAGTGILTALLIERAKKVYAVEPNREMRTEAERCLGQYASFVSVDGTAEKTTLASGSVDLITVAQAFHWFDPDRTKDEFRRILRLAGVVCLVWNKRMLDSEFARAYENAIRELVPEYTDVGCHKVTAEMIETFFGHRIPVVRFSNAQCLDWDGLLGRLRSSSYTPPAGSDAYRALEGRLRNAFERNVTDGVVRFDYRTELYAGRFH